MKKLFAIVLTLALLLCACPPVFTANAAGKTVISQGKSYTTTTPNYQLSWDADRMKDDGKRLTDGVKSTAKGDSNAYSAWIGDVEVVIDLGAVMESDVYTLYAAGDFWGISCPASITVSVSNSPDSGFVQVASSSTQTLLGSGNDNKLYSITATASEVQSARYIKFSMDAYGNFLWIDEVQVLRSTAASPMTSVGKSYTTTTPNYELSWDADRMKDDGVRLTDGIKATVKGDSNAYSSWRGDVEVIIDLGAVTQTDTYSLYASGGYWGISCPKSITVSVSNDAGSGFTQVAASAEKTLLADDTEVKRYVITATASTVQHARYVKFAIEAAGQFVWIDETEVSLSTPGSIGSEVNAADYGLSPDASGLNNSTTLQYLIDTLSAQGGGTVYIPAGEYEFAEIGTQTYGSHCIKMKSNVSVIGDGDSTVLKPVGVSDGGLDMFYFNDYVDTGKAVYLENCRFENFMIDSAGTSTPVYTSAGKGFMFNLFRNCHWKGVTVKNTDGTGFGVDCPIDSSITDCIAINCGKAATNYNVGASGFGIGFGYSEEESFTITNCQSYGNKKYGFFFEHQGRFNATNYAATCAEGFTVTDCVASGNYYNFGGAYSMDTVYENCHSSEAIQHGYFFENSVNCKAVNCVSENETDTAFVILQSTMNNKSFEVSNNLYDGCVSYGSKYGMKVVSLDGTALMENNTIQNCTFNAPTLAAAYTLGTMEGLTLTGNTSDVAETSFTAEIDTFVNENNSWN